MIHPLMVSFSVQVPIFFLLPKLCLIWLFCVGRLLEFQPILQGLIEFPQNEIFRLQGSGIDIPPPPQDNSYGLQTMFLHLPKKRKWWSTWCISLPRTDDKRRLDLLLVTISSSIFFLIFTRNRKPLKVKPKALVSLEFFRKLAIALCQKKHSR